MVKYLLDTNVVSEATKAHANPAISQWLAEVPAADTFISVITVAELRAGAELMPEGGRRRHFEQWIEHQILRRFRSNIVDVDIGVGEQFGLYPAEDRKRGRSTSPLDLLIAATASARHFTVATRNTKDFEHLDVPIINPWTEEATS